MQDPLMHFGILMQVMLKRPRLYDPDLVTHGDHALRGGIDHFSEVGGLKETSIYTTGTITLLIIELKISK